MSREIDLTKDSDDNGEWPNAVSVPPLPLSRKRPRNEVFGNEDGEIADHRESHEGIAAAASQPMNSDSEQTSRDDGSANKHSQEPSTSKPSSNAAGRQGRNPAWEDRLSELTDCRKIYGHCNIPIKSYSENTKLGEWVGHQRTQYRKHLEGETSPMTLSRIQKLESLGFEWKPHNSRKKGNPKKPSHDNDTTRVRERAVEALESQEDFSGREIHRNQVDVPKNPTVMEKSTSPTSRCRTSEI
jgi:hypothetical protein